MRFISFFMQTDTNQQHTYINTPVDYMERAKSSSFHKQLLAFWLCIKFNRGDSAYRPTVAGIMKDFKCGHKTAKRLLEHVKSASCALFRYNPATNLLVATTWKRNPIEKYVSCAPNKRALMKYCVKVYKPKELSIRTAIKAMQRALAKVAISEKQRLDKFLTEGKQFSSCSDRADALNQKKLGRIVGCHRSTISRLMRQMQEDGELNIIEHKPFAVYDLEHGEWLLDDKVISANRIDKRKLIPIGKKAYVRDANEYKLTKFGNERDVRNVIFNYGKRIGFNPLNTTKRSNNYCDADLVDNFYFRNSQFC